MIPKEKTVAVVEHQLKAARAWTQRKGGSLDWRREDLELRAVLTHPETGDEFYLQGRFEDYPALPPQWTFCSTDWEGCGEKRFFPASNGSQFGSVMHSNGLICAHFSRDSFGEYGGPHSNWGGPAQWVTPKDDTVYADTIGDMLEVIYRDLTQSKGRMG
jgi:hypothetical protein